MKNKNYKEYPLEMLSNIDFFNSSLTQEEKIMLEQKRHIKYSLDSYLNQEPKKKLNKSQKSAFNFANMDEENFIASIRTRTLLTNSFLNTKKLYDSFFYKIILLSNNKEDQKKLENFSKLKNADKMFYLLRKSNLINMDEHSKIIFDFNQLELAKITKALNN